MSVYQLKNLSFDEMLQLFQELLQDVLGSLFEEDQVRFITTMSPKALLCKSLLLHHINNSMTSCILITKTLVHACLKG